MNWYSQYQKDQTFAKYYRDNWLGERPWATSRRSTLAKRRVTCLNYWFKLWGGRSQNLAACSHSANVLFIGFFLSLYTIYWLSPRMIR
jgi:hypothetical protein